MKIKTGDLIMIKGMWPDHGDLEPLLHVTAVSKSRLRPCVFVMVLSGKDLGAEHQFTPTDVNTILKVA